jgi:pyridoxal phosphate enzyme (YggS family)|tara:strand:- start:2108 stop:2755 length:648 start_codon:yes stop_codon:yes gene_type:complete
MHDTVKNLINIKEEIKLNNKSYTPKIIAVSKTFKIDHILPLIEHGHFQFGENKVQEALEKWPEIKSKNTKIQLHMVGKLQSNKVKHALKIFDYIHSLDSMKLANKISTEQKKINKKPKIFIQINIGNESQKSGIMINEFEPFYEYCKKLELEIIGTMCLPPDEKDPNIYFSKMKELNDRFNISELSMGMSNDYIIATNYMSTYLRIGSKIFGQRN